MTEQPTSETRMIAVDGTDALAYVILRPGKDETGIVIEAAAKGISKPYAAYALRHTAQSWDPDNTVGQDVGEQLKAAEAEIARLRAELAEYTHPVATCSTCHHIAPWHVGQLGHTERPCTHHACGCTDLTKES